MQVVIGGHLSLVGEGSSSAVCGCHLLVGDCHVHGYLSFIHGDCCCPWVEGSLLSLGVARGM